MADSFLREPAIIIFEDLERLFQVTFCPVADFIFRHTVEQFAGFPFYVGISLLAASHQGGDGSGCNCGK